jgi:hypothetical protein
MIQRKDNVGFWSYGAEELKKKYFQKMEIEINK